MELMRAVQSVPVIHDEVTEAPTPAVGGAEEAGADGEDEDERPEGAATPPIDAEEGEEDDGADSVEASLLPRAPRPTGALTESEKASARRTEALFKEAERRKVKGLSLGPSTAPLLWEVVGVS